MVRTNPAQTVASQGVGTKNPIDLPLEVVKPKIFAYLTVWYSFLGNHLLGLWNTGSFFSALVM